MTTLLEPATTAIPDRPYTRACDRCGALFRVLPCDVRKALKRGQNPRRFCSTKCQHESYRGAGNPKWRGGLVDQTSGYIYQYSPTHPHATQAGYVMQHRLVMEAAIGRYLRPEEEVHHRNHVRGDNRIENLELMASAAAHRARHAYYENGSCGICGEELRRSIAHRRRWSRAYCSRRCAAYAGSIANAAKARAAR
jgi:hypothetical protein